MSRRRKPFRSSRSSSTVFVKTSYARRLRTQQLEDRRLLAVLTVTNLDDSGTGSLRDAINTANISTGVADEIVFQASLNGTINLQSQLPTITDSLTITGGNNITLDAGNGTDNVFSTFDGFRIFDIDNLHVHSQIDVTLSGLTLTGGDTTGSGGAILNQENLTLTSSTLSRNAASLGGGIFNDGAATITSSTIAGNDAVISGGGFYNDDFSTAAITSSTISSNDADDIGGGIFNDGAVTITSSTISDNDAAVAGGAIYNEISGTATITSSTISGNDAGDIGGGIFNFGTTTITSSTISSNDAAGDGGGVFNFGSATITSSTITRNDAVIAGGGIYNESFGTATVTSSIVADNTAPTNPNIDGRITDEGFNLIDGDPLLGPLADNGGPTLTHALLAGSQALDVGSSSEATDQRGLPRVVGGQADIGAFEAQGLVTQVPGDYNGDNSVNAADYTVWRDTVGSTGLTPLTGADGDGDGAVTIADYNVWRTHFGFEFTPPPQNTEANSSATVRMTATAIVTEEPSVIPAEPFDAVFALLAPQVARGSGVELPVTEQEAAAPAQGDRLLLIALAQAEEPAELAPAVEALAAPKEDTARESALTVAIGGFE